MNMLIIALLFFVNDDISVLQEKAVKSFDAAEKKILTVKVDDNVISKCPCDGKGHIVHGDGHRTKCPGTEKGPCEFAKQEPVNAEVTRLPEAKTGPTIDPRPNTKAVKPIKKPILEHGIIYMYSRDDCYYCKVFKQSSDLKGMLKIGWRLIEFNGSGGAVPRFKVMMGGKAYPINGMLTTAKLNTVNSAYIKSTKK